MMNFNDILDEIYVDDEFPVKTHDSATRRKKTYLKGKHRYELLRQKNQLPPRKKDSVLRGMTRKTYIANSCKDWLISYGFRKHHNTVRREWSANDKMNEYAMEV